MNVWKSACAVALATGIACGAQAATYSVNGVLTGVDVGFAQATFNPTNPAFSGAWNIDLSALSLSGVADFESYQASTVYTGWLEDPITHEYFYGSAGTTLTRPHDVQTIDGSSATYAYDPVLRTLTVTNPHITLTGNSQDCVAFGGWECGDPDYIPETLDEITLLLTFSEDLRSFTGVSTITRRFVNGNPYSDTTYWSFSGTAVPVPAAAWMLGSGLIGLAGIARRKQQQ